MSDGRLELQKDIYGALTGNATLMAKITGVFDFVPDNQAYPFIQIGEMQFLDFGSVNTDGFEATLTIHTWGRPGTRGRAPIHDIQNDIYDTLHKNLFSIPGYTVLSSRFLNSEIIVEEDAVTYHGISRFRLILGEN